MSTNLKQNKFHKFFLVGLFAFAFIFVGAKVSFAATLNLTTTTTSFAIGTEFNADVKIDSEDAGTNAAQATIQFPPSSVQVVSIDTKTNSVFDFWLQDPADPKNYSNKDGKITFVGGSSVGVGGKSLQILRVHFKVIGGGKSSIIFTDAAITASDGSASNVLTASNGLTFSAGGTAAVTQIGITQIERTAIESKKIPEKPVVTVPSYPDQDKWYDISSNFNVSWKLPGDVTDVAALIDKNPNTDPLKSEGLFDNKTFTPLEDGVSYLHVRFKNKAGWGPTTHYKISIDTVPPSSFKTDIPDGAIFDTATPVINFEAADALSGIDFFHVIIDGQTVGTTKEKSFTLPIQTPGKKKIVMMAHDAAGNAIFSRAEIEIRPISAPVIISMSKDTYAGEGNLSAKGSSITDAKIKAVLKSSTGGVISSREVNSVGHEWAVAFPDILSKGDYYIEVTATDKSGLLSDTVKSEVFSIKDRPVLSIFGLNVSKNNLILIILSIVALVSVIISISTKSKLLQKRRKVIIAERDVNNFLNLIQDDIHKVIAIHKKKKKTPTDESETDFLLGKIHDKIKEAKKYVLENIAEIED